MLLEILGNLIVVSLLGVFLYIHYKHYQYSHLPQNPRDSFIFGHANKIKQSIRDEGVYGVYHLDLVRTYGDVFCYWLMINPKVFVTDPLFLKDMFTDVKRFTRPGGMPLAQIGNARMLGNHSVITDHGGPIWRHKKRVMDPAFSMSKLTLHLTKFQRIAVDVTDTIEETIKKTEVINMRDLFKPFTIDAISIAGFSATEDERKKLNGANNRLEMVMQDVAQGTSKLRMLLDPVKRKAIKNAEASIKRTRELGAELITERTSSGKFGSYDDILDHVIEANIEEKTGSINIEDCLDDFLTMYFAGNATTLTTLSWSMAELVRNPDALNQLRDEVDEVWCSAEIDGSSDPHHIGNALREMKYLEAFVKEVLRYHPPVCFSAKKCVYPESVGGYALPPNTVCQTSQYVMHRYEKFWENPEKFNPNRFIDSNPKPYTYFPFLMGPRQCMGKNFAILELKVILCEILKKYDLFKPKDSPDKIKSAQAFLCFPLSSEVILKPRH